MPQDQEASPALADLVLLDELVGGRLLDELAAARGRRVVPIEAPDPTDRGLGERAGAASCEWGRTLDILVRALADGVVTPLEAADARGRVAACVRVLGELEADLRAREGHISRAVDAVQRAARPRDGAPVALGAGTRQ